MKRAKGIRTGGFTLLEVLLVITIIGILAAFVVPRLIGVGDQAKIDIAATAVGKSSNIALALDLFYQKIGRYPTTNEGLKALIEKPEDSDEFARWTQLISDPNMLKDPWGREYQYSGPDSAQYNKPSGEGKQDAYDLWSTGPDRTDGNDDDIGNWTKER